MAQNQTSHEEMVVISDETISTASKIRHSYTNAVKIRALQRVEELRERVKFPVVVTASELCISVRCLRKCVTDAASIREAKPILKRNHLGNKTFTYEEAHCVSYVKEQRESRLAVSTLDVAVEVSKAYPASFASVKQCRNWVCKILDRNQLSICCKTHDSTAMTTRWARFI